MTVRLVEANETTAAYRLRLEALTDSPYAFGSTQAEEEGLNEDQILERFGPSADGFVMGAFSSEGRLVGMVGCRRQKGVKRRHAGQIWGLFVTPEARCQGVAKALMGRVLDHARDLGEFSQVTLGASNVAEPAKALYRSLGFRTYGIEPDAHRQDGRSFDMEFMVAACVGTEVSEASSESC